jgi:peptidoglycan/LPS O-acetylase OafA/YrhL
MGGAAIDAAAPALNKALTKFEDDVAHQCRFHRWSKKANMVALHLLGIGAAVLAGAAAVTALEGNWPGLAAILAAVAGALAGGCGTEEDEVESIAGAVRTVPSPP